MRSGVVWRRLSGGRVVPVVVARGTQSGQANLLSFAGTLPIAYSNRSPHLLIKLGLVPCFRLQARFSRRARCAS